MAAAELRSVLVRLERRTKGAQIVLGPRASWNIVAAPCTSLPATALTYIGEGWLAFDAPGEHHDAEGDDESKLESVGVHGCLLLRGRDGYQRIDPRGGREEISRGAAIAASPRLCGSR